MNVAVKRVGADARPRPTSREPHWNGNGNRHGFNDQLRIQCILDLDRAREMGGDAAIAAWFRKWDRNIEATIWSERA